MGKFAAKLTIAVVIPVWNGQATIGRCLESLAAQTRLPDEIICVDNNSTDSTVARVTRFISEHPEVKVVLAGEFKQCAAAARNRGWRLAQSELIAFIDADAFASPDWLSNVEKIFVEEGWDGVGGIHPMWQPRTIVEKLQTFEFVYPTHFYGKPLEDRSHCLFGQLLVTCNATYRRTVLEKTSGFDDSMTMVCEDSDLTVRALDAGAKLVIFRPDVRVEHVIHRSYRKFLRRIFEYRHSLATLVRKDFKKRAFIQLPFLGILEFPCPFSVLVSNESYFAFSALGGVAASYFWHPFTWVYAAAMLYLVLRLMRSYRMRAAQAGIPVAAFELGVILVLDILKKFVAMAGRLYGSIRERVLVL